MAQTAVMIGPAEHGKAMSLADFDHAEVLDGYLYELGRGVITVSDVPKPRHFAQVNGLRRQLEASSTHRARQRHTPFGNASACRRRLALSGLAECQCLPQWGCRALL